MPATPPAAATASPGRHAAPDPDRYETYLLDSDPDELVNVPTTPRTSPSQELEAQLDALLA